jgi:site-specific DNA-methyltransferase (adenine-specific)
VYDSLNAEFGFTFDPCPLLSRDNGAKIRWSGRVFCNPPYSHIAEFILSGLWALSVHECELLVYLLPARTDTAWFHDYCLKSDEIRFVRGRLKFGGAVNSAPFPSMVVVFNKWILAPVPILCGA